MTNEEINEAVARKLGAIKLKECECSDPYDDHWELTHEWNNRKYTKHLPPYSTSISAAWEIVESIPDGKFAIYKDNPNGYTVTDGQSDEYSTILGRADTAPMAICLAFLKLEKP